MLYLKISGLKISVDSLKIAGLKIIARVCVYVRMWVRGCAPHLANISKIVQDATGATTTEHRNTSDHHKSSTRAGATTTGTPAHAYSKRNYKNNSKLIFF